MKISKIQLKYAQSFNWKLITVKGNNEERFIELTFPISCNDASYRIKKSKRILHIRQRYMRAYKQEYYLQLILLTDSTDS